MGIQGWFVIGIVCASMIACQTTEPTKVLRAPMTANSLAARHNDEGIQAYNHSQWERAKQHFEAAIDASPELAEAHYNLGKALYKLGARGEGDRHFIQAANLAPGNKIIWDSPPLKRVDVPSKEMPFDGHGHQH